jgi:hypothetical protein
MDALSADVEVLKRSPVDGLEAELKTKQVKTSTADALSTARALRTPPAASWPHAGARRHPLFLLYDHD